MQRTRKNHLSVSHSALVTQSAGLDTHRFRNLYIACARQLHTRTMLQLWLIYLASFFSQIRNWYKTQFFEHRPKEQSQPFSKCLSMVFHNIPYANYANKYIRKGSSRKRNTKHKPISKAKHTHTHTTLISSVMHQLVKNTRKTVYCSFDLIETVH